ncbi:MAG: hypothetical protein NZ874_05945 [Fimbriimonadales bacterium]|nr:hypothetical protein [Fimbriimonadales bacterium]
MQTVVHKMTQWNEQEHAAHLDAEQILELVERGRRCRRYEEYIDHITECAVCRETYKQLLQAEQMARATRQMVWMPRLRFWLPATAAAMLLLFFGVRALLRDGAEVAGLRQANGVWYEGTTRLPSWAFTAAAQFANPPAPMRDAPREAPALRLTSPNPANAAIESLTPEFRWEPVPDAVRYRAWLERADGQQRINLVVEGERATLPQAKQLEAGVAYRLTIEALAPDERAGDGLKSVYEFRTLTPTEQQQLRWARANRSAAPRVCTVVFYQLGFYADALETLDRLPNEPLATQWRAALLSRRQNSGSYTNQGFK